MEEPLGLGQPMGLPPEVKFATAAPPAYGAAPASAATDGKVNGASERPLDQTGKDFKAVGNGKTPTWVKVLSKLPDKLIPTSVKTKMMGHLNLEPGAKVEMQKIGIKGDWELTKMTQQRGGLKTEYTGKFKIDSSNTPQLRSGTIKYPDGSTYEGGVKNGIPEGTGKYTAKDGSTQEGTFKNGKLHGENCKMTNSTGVTYTGSFKEGKIVPGGGKFVIPDGLRKYTDMDGITRDGFFKNGKLDGQATLTFPKSGDQEVKTREAMFNDGEFQDWIGEGETAPPPNPPSQADRSFEPTQGNTEEPIPPESSFVFEGTPQSTSEQTIPQGRLEWDDGDTVWQGGVVDGKPEGPGTLMKDGNTLEGEYSNGKFVETTRLFQSVHDDAASIDSFPDVFLQSGSVLQEGIPSEQSDVESGPIIDSGPVSHSEGGVYKEHVDYNGGKFTGHVDPHTGLPSDGRGVLTDREGNKWIGRFQDGKPAGVGLYQLGGNPQMSENNAVVIGDDFSKINHYIAEEGQPIVEGHPVSEADIQESIRLGNEEEEVVEEEEIDREALIRGDFPTGESKIKIPLSKETLMGEHNARYGKPLLDADQVQSPDKEADLTESVSLGNEEEEEIDREALIRGDFPTGESKIKIPLSKVTLMGEHNARYGNRLDLGGGKTYVGEAKDGMPEGKGTLTNDRLGTVFEGEFENGIPNGWGTLTRNGITYEGVFKSGEMSGFFKVTYPNGGKYIGNLVDGKFEGKGTLITFLPEGKGCQIQEGTFSKGNFLGGNKATGKNLDSAYSLLSSLSKEFNEKELQLAQTFAQNGSNPQLLAQLNKQKEDFLSNLKSQKMNQPEQEFQAAKKRISK